jgi:hypothetical protein
MDEESRGRENKTTSQIETVPIRKKYKQCQLTCRPHKIEIDAKGSDESSTDRTEQIQRPPNSGEKHPQITWVSYSFSLKKPDVPSVRRSCIFQGIVNKNYS